jgi:hypothetical protein
VLPSVRRLSHRQIAVVFVLIAIAVSIQKFFAEAYNNYLVFTGSLRVLLAHGPLYAPHPEHYGDLFKYSPTFPLFMLPFLPLPLLLGIIGWNAVNALALYAAIRRLWADERRVVIALLLVAVELTVSLQHVQSNALVAALVILAFVELERARSWRAGFYIAAGFFLKVYGAAAGCLALLYRHRIKSVAASAVWFAALAAAPLIVLSWGELVDQYQAWLNVGGTFTVMRNMSLMRVAVQYLDPDLNPVVIQAAGALLLVAPFARIRAYSDRRFRIRLLCSLLIAMVIFNNSAEPPTYVIALAGAAIWYASEDRSRRDRWLTLPLLLVILLISTDVYPRPFRAYAGPWTVKAIGCLVVWLRINWELLTSRYEASVDVADFSLEASR